MNTIKEIIKKVKAYIFRNWKNENIDSRIKIIPPFVFDFLAYLFYFVLIYKFISYLLK